MRCRSEVVVRTLQELELQVAAFRDRAAALAKAFSRGDIPMVVRGTGEAGRGLDSIAASMMSLKREVLPQDGLGDTMDSLAELVTRAVRLVVLVQLGDLRDVFRDPVANARARTLFTGRFRDIEDVIAFVHGELDRIDGTWTRYRSGGEQAMAIDGNRVLYRAVIGAAQRAVRAIGADPDFVHFLREGATCVDRPTVCRGCTQIIAALNIKIDPGAAHTAA
jgi:hypothetical protein